MKCIEKVALENICELKFMHWKCCAFKNNCALNLLALKMYCKLKVCGEKVCIETTALKKFHDKSLRVNYMPRTHISIL